MRGIAIVIDAILELKNRCNFGDEIGRAYRLTAREVGCIFKIAAHQSISSKDLSHLMGLSASRGSRIVSKLADRGFIHAEIDSEDRRLVRLSLTMAGKHCNTDILREKQACEQRLSAKLSEEQQEIVRQALDLLLKVI